jgi:two-component system phosphate regulon sensor histidine kinase PhoR
MTWNRHRIDITVLLTRIASPFGPLSENSLSMSDPARARTVFARIRWAALRGSLVTAVIMAVTVGIRGTVDLWLIPALLIALLASLSVDALFGVPETEEGRGVPPSLQARGSADTLLAHIPDPAILVDGRTVVVDANPAALRLLPGLKKAQPLSFALRSPDVLGAIDAAVASGAPVRVEYSERVPTELSFEVQVSPLRDQSGAGQGRSGAVLFFRDLTSARRLETMRVDFVASASHELRTPLASLLGFIETLQGPARKDPKAQERFLEIMREQAQRMRRLIDDLLSLSRIEMRAHLPPRGTVELTGAVRQIVETLSPVAQARQVAVTIALPVGPVPVPGEADEILRVIENLVENAIKYGDSGGRVEVELAVSETSACFSVRDHGPGIAPEHLPRLTERFYRADASQSREKGGTGLGLAIVKHIVNRHRGSLVIESELGKGALFKVTLPLAAP